MSQVVKNEKAALRKRIKIILGKIETGEVEEQSRLVTEKVLELPAYRDAKSISIFLSMPGREISTNSIVLDALRKDKKVFIPYIYSLQDDHSSKSMAMLRLKDESDLRSLNSDAWGIPSLSAEGIDLRENAMGGYGISDATAKPADSQSIELIFMPGMAFDRSNNRLGHGKGFYDKYLSQLQQASGGHAPLTPRPTLVGLALREQLLANGEEIPVNEYDWKVDQLVIAD